MAFAYWVKKSATTQTLGSVLWKFWRFRFSTSYTSPMLSEKQVWTDMNDDGDGLGSGRPQNTQDKLGHYLNSMYCYGKLTPEKVCDVNIPAVRLCSGVVWSLLTML